jgi:hypothetical protein
VITLDHISSSRREEPFALFRKLDKEIKELYYAIGYESPERIREEALDVANFAMMIFDMTLPEAKQPTKASSTTRGDT